MISKVNHYKIRYQQTQYKFTLLFKNVFLQSSVTYDLRFDHCDEKKEFYNVLKF